MIDYRDGRAYANRDHGISFTGFDVHGREVTFLIADITLDFYGTHGRNAMDVFNQHRPEIESVAERFYSAEGRTTVLTNDLKTMGGGGYSIDC